MLFYQLHEMGRAWMKPWTLLADANARAFAADGTWTLGPAPKREVAEALLDLIARRLEADPATDRSG